MFEESEQRHAVDSPQYPMLYGTAGYRYCELLLELGEGEEVERRGRRMFDWRVDSDPLLYLGLDHLSLACSLWTLGRPAAREHFASAIDNVRAAGQQGYLPSALVLHAAFLRETGDREGAARALNEAVQISVRSEMRLAECDARLEQARQTLDSNDLPTARSAFETARTLIDDCSYHRRDCELALIESRIAHVAGDPDSARAALTRARTIATDQKLRIHDAELAALESLLA